MRRALTICLMAANGLVLFISLSWALGLLGQKAAAPLGAQRVSVPPQSGANAAASPETQARYALAPLFRKDRSFPAIKQAPVAAVSQSFGPPRAIGTILSSNAGPWVLLVHPNTQQTQKVAVGSSFAGWDVASVSETAVELRRDSQIIQLDIRP